MRRLPGKGRSIHGAVLAAVVGVAVAAATISATAAGPSAPSIVEDPWFQAQKVTPEDSDQPGVSGLPSHWGVSFGADVAIDGDTLVVGAQTDSISDSGGEESDGFDWAYVFHRASSGEWEQVDKLVPEDARKGDTFAASLDVDEDAGLIVVGNPEARKVYVFEPAETGGWKQSATAEVDIDGFGVTVSVSEDTFITGARMGTLFVYERSSSGWERASTISEASAIAEIQDDRIAATVEPSWRQIAIYDRVGGEWRRSASLPLSEALDRPASRPMAIAFSDDRSTVVAGAKLDTRIMGADTGIRGVTLPAVGSAQIYQKEDDGWVMARDLGNPDPAPYEKFGRSVDVSRDVVVVGAPGDVHNGAQAAGAVYVYVAGEEGWSLEEKLRSKDSTLPATSVGPGGGDWFGESVGVNGTTIVAGAPFDDNRGDGSPYPLNDWADIPPCVHPGVLWECDHGENAGSVYTFEPRGVLSPVR